MEFTNEEKEKLLEYVAINLMKSCQLSLAEAKRIVNSSILVSKIETSPSFIAHCSPRPDNQTSERSVAKSGYYLHIAPDFGNTLLY